MQSPPTPPVSSNCLANREFEVIQLLSAFCVKTGW
jgi:hypothetical protein